MKISTKKLAVSAMMLAVAMMGQFFFRGIDNISGQILTGTTVNLSLVFTTLYCGPLCGILLAITTPITAYLIAAGAVLLNIPIILLGIILGNITYVIVIDTSIKLIKKWEFNIPKGIFSGTFALTLPSVIIASIAKALVMVILIVYIILPTFKNNLPNPDIMVPIANVTFSTTQLITALIAGGIASIIWPTLKVATEYLFVEDEFEDEDEDGED